MSDARLGKKWNEIKPRTSLQEHGFSFEDIKKWRTNERDAGRPYGLRDFYQAHDLCFECGSRGVQMIGLDESDIPLWEICDKCGGAGKPFYHGPDLPDTRK